MQDDIIYLSAVDMAAQIRSGQLSARDLMQAHLARIEAVNPTVNAIVTLHAEQALAASLAADEAQAHGKPLGPLHGLPVAHKDLILTRGMRTTYGSRVHEHYVPTRSALLVERQQAAGAISIGKTNTPEFGAGSQTFNEVFGATRNPYDLGKTCGGSSGGSAVALATGMVALADGTDMGGSLRCPANFCNVVGLRPAVGRVPHGAQRGRRGAAPVGHGRP
jgi:amidase